MVYEPKYYLKYPIDYKKIYEILEVTNAKKINLFVDFNGIARGLYRKDVVLMEVSSYLTNKKVSGILVEELRQWMNNIYRRFKSYDICFIIFYDLGVCAQNRLLSSGYKSSRSLDNLRIDDDEKLTDIFRKIKKYYYQKIREEFHEKADMCFIHYTGEYESDCLPHFCLMHNIYDSLDTDTCNLILSLDKDLGQSTEIGNTLLCPTGYKQNEDGKFIINFQMFDKNNVIQYMYKRFQPGILTAKHIPIILAIAGDTSDSIIGLPNIGVAKAIKLISENNIPYTIDGLKQNINTLPSVIQNEINLVISNLKITRFEDQIQRLPNNFINM